MKTIQFIYENDKLQECLLNMNDAKKELNEIMAITIDDWRANNRQLIIPFESAEIEN